MWVLAGYVSWEIVSFHLGYWICGLKSFIVFLYYPFDAHGVCRIPSFISDISNLCLLYFLVSLEGGLSVLLIFQGISFWFCWFCLWYIVFNFIDFYSNSYYLFLLLTLDLICSSFYSCLQQKLRLPRWC